MKLYEVAETNMWRVVGKIMNEPHQPTLKVLVRRNGKLVLMKREGKKIVYSDEVKRAEKVRDFSYAEEELLIPVKVLSRARGEDLTPEEFETKILKALYPHDEFNAYTFKLGKGFDPYYVHVEGELYNVE